MRIMFHERLLCLRTTPPHAVILFTKNWAGKGQAGKYAADAVDRALAAASKNGCSAILFTPDDDADLLAAVPEGRFGAQDRPLLPSAKVAIFKRLVAMAEGQAHEDRNDAQEADAAPQAAAEADAVKPAGVQPHANAGTSQAAAMLAKTSEKAAGGAIVSVIVKDGAAHWPDLAKGDVVLAPEFRDGEYSGWWEAVMVARSESHVTLEWRDYEGYPTFTRPITQVAPFHPECAIQG